MEFLNLQSTDSKLVSEIINRCFERFSLAKALVAYRSESGNVNRIGQSILSCCHLLCAQRKTSKDKKLIPIGVCYTRNRLDPIWSLVYGSAVLCEWKKILASAQERNFIEFELQAPHIINNKEFFESDASDVFKQLRKLPGWRRACTYGKFLTSLKRAGNALTVTVQCITVLKDDSNKQVVSRYTRMAWKILLRKQLPGCNASGGLISKPSTLPEINCTNYLKTPDKKWDLNFIEKLIDKGSTSIPKVHSFGEIKR